MKNSKKPLAVLSMAAVAGLIATAVTVPASAKTTAIVINGNDGKTYQYDLTSLDQSATNVVLGNTTGTALYNDFLTKYTGGSLNAVYDNVKNAYVNISVVENAAINAITSGTPFDLDTFTSATSTPSESLTPSAIVSTDASGNVVDTSGTPATQALAVQSVSALNVKQISVTFNEPVDQTTAETVTNYTLDGTALVSNSDTAKLQADGKTVIITLGSTLTNQTSHKLDVANVKDTNANVMTTSTGNAFSVLDTAIPQAVSATLVSPTQVKVTFSAPIMTTVTTDYLLDNGQYSVVNALSNPVDDSVTLTLGTALPSGAHSLVIAPSTSNTAPIAYNTFKVANTTLSFNATTNTTAPTVSVGKIQLASASTTTVQFKFSEPVALNSADFYYAYDKTGSAGTATVDPSATVDGSYADTYDVTFNTAIPTGAATFYVDNAADVTTGSTNYIEDAWANKFTSTSVAGNFAIDTTKPTATSVVMNGQDKIDVTFSKTVATATSGVNYTLTDSQGNIVTPATLSGVALDYSGHPTSITDLTGTKGYYELNLGASLKPGTYTLTVSGVQDTVLPVANTMDSKTYTLTVADTTAPTVTKVTYDTTNTKLFVYYSKAMTVSGTGSIVNTANYQFNGAALPTGTTIAAMNNNTVAVITLPTAQTAFTSLIVGAVNDSVGNTISGFAQTISTIQADGLAASDIVAGSAKATANNTITFEVDQPLSGINATDILINATQAGSASYVNQMVNNGTQYGALVTLTAGTSFGTGTTGLSVTLNSGALTNVNGGSLTSTATISTIADKVAPILSTASVSDITTPANSVTGTVSTDGKTVTVDLKNVAGADQLNNVSVGLTEDAAISIPMLTINGVTIPAQTVNTTGGVATINLSQLVGITDNGNNGVAEQTLKQLAGASTTISVPVTLIDKAGNVTSGTITITDLH
jgi:hypothetical protein